MTGPIPIVLCVDVEPDERRPAGEDGPVSYAGYDAMHALLAQSRERFAASTGRAARFSWFLRMDPQIEAVHGAADGIVREYGARLEGAEREGDEIGLHPHAWRWREARAGWIADWADAAWVETCLRGAFSAYREAFGRTCESVRMGDRFLDGATWSLLEDLGARRDLTVEPGIVGPPANLTPSTGLGAWPDCRRSPQVPFRSSRDRFPLPVRRSQGLVEIPHTSGRAAARTIGGRMGAWAGVVPPRRLANAPRRVWQCHPAVAPDSFRALLDWVLRRRRRPYLAFALRADQSLGEAGAHVRANLLALAKHPGARRFAFTTPGEFLALRGLSPAPDGRRAPLALPAPR